MSLGGSKIEHFSCFPISCQTGLTQQKGSEYKNDDTIYEQPLEVLGHLPGWLMVAVLSVMTASVTEVRKYLIIVTGRGDDLKILGAKY